MSEEGAGEEVQEVRRAGAQATLGPGRISIFALTAPRKAAGRF